MSGSRPPGTLTVIIWDSTGFPAPPVRSELQFSRDTTVASFRQRVLSVQLQRVFPPTTPPPPLTLPYWALSISCMPGEAGGHELISDRLPQPNAIGRLVGRVSFATWLPFTLSGKFGVAQQESERQFAQIRRRNGEVGALLLALLPRVRKQQNARNCDGGTSARTERCFSPLAKLPLELLSLIYRIWRSSGGGVDAGEVSRINAQLRAEKLKKQQLEAAELQLRLARAKARIRVAPPTARNVPKPLYRQTAPDMNGTALVCCKRKACSFLLSRFFCACFDVPRSLYLL